jgi:predicted nuclease of restriction endonuclease-like (RecB) superfamily
MPNIQTTEYKEFIQKIKVKARQAQIKASVRVNSTLLEFYWELGADIVEKQKTASWGSGFLKQMSRDLMSEFSNIKGFSLRNIKYIRQWYLFYCEEDEKGQQVVAQLVLIPWGQNLHIITKCKNINEALFYVHKTMKNGWSRSVLVHQIESRLYERSGKAITNFSNTLANPQSDLANELTKDPYQFDFLMLREKHNERELEDALMEHMTKFLLELGQGFAFVGRQYKLDVGGRDFKIDLLFYHLKLYCYVVVELKVVDFEPEFAGKLNFYISAVDGELKSKKDNPTIGILICKSKNSTIVEYSLKDINKPIGVSEYRLSNILPKEFKSSLPSIEEIEAEFENIEIEEKD